MRSLLIIATALLTGTTGFTQTGTPVHSSNTPLIYGETTIGPGNYASANMALNVFVARDNILSLQYAYGSHIAPNVPSDYNGGLLGSAPEQSITSLGLCYGKVIRSGSPYVRYTIKGGISAGYLHTPTNFQADNSGWFGANYNYATRNQFLAGLVLNPSVEFPLTRHFGFTLGGYANINAWSSVFCIRGGIIFGKLRNRIHPINIAAE